MEPCGACLSRGRRVSALGVARAARVLRAAAEPDVDTTLLSRLAVCWECRTFVEKSIIFFERVRCAQTALRDENLTILSDAEGNTASMSTLGLSTKVGFDCIYQFPDHDEVKYGLHETDVATTDHVATLTSQESDMWEVSVSPTTLFPADGLEEVNGETVIMTKMEDMTESESGDDADDNIDMEVQDNIDNIEIKVEDNIDHKEIIKNNFEPTLKENFSIVMRDLTKNPKTSKTNNSTNIVPPSLTIKRINGNEIKELKPSELKTILIKPSEEEKKCNETKKIIVKPGAVTIKKQQKPSKIKKEFLSEVEMQQCRDEERKKEQYVQSLFKCGTCIVGFQSEALLEDHDKIRHRPELGDYSCDVCDLRIKHPDSVAWHRMTHFTMYVCSKCGYARQHLPDVKRHYASSHEPPQTHQCQKCEEVFATPGQLSYHVEKTHYEAEKCSQCDKTFTTICSYKRHVDNVHGDRTPVPCPTCGRKYRGEQNMRLHMVAAHRAKPAQPSVRPRCEPCGVTFHNEPAYRMHLKTSKKHVAVEDMKFQCALCDKRCAAKGSLQDHLETVHNPHKNVPCQQCDKMYGSERALRRHEHNVHSAAYLERVRDQVCEHCGKAFYTKKALLVHAVVHSDVRPFVCSVCDASFRFYAALFTHNKLKHEGRKIIRKRRNPAAKTKGSPT